jgi:cyclophilin family peptidyl-prolyl cis-trans isomerase
MNRLALISLLLVGAAAPKSGPKPAPLPASKAALSPAEIVAAAPAADWVAIDLADLLVMDLVPDTKGKQRRVVIQLMPPPFSQGWIGNIRKLAAAKWWDGTSVNRVQDNYVVQWGDVTEKKALPEGLVNVPESEYVSRIPHVLLNRGPASPEFGSDQYPLRDLYAVRANFAYGWPIGIEHFPKGKGPTGRGALDPKTAWPIHCYGMVGVGRGLPPDTGTGAELYTVIGHAPRHLDRNIALVGRVIEGIEHLSSLPRGTGALGFYEKVEERVPITSVRIANELPTDKSFPTFQTLSTESATFAKYADARANRRDPFFITPAGGADICNIPVPVRRKP